MSKLARALIVAGTVAALSLAGTAAVAQPNDETTQQEMAENWNYYQQSTRVPPTELKAQMQTDAAQRELSERWTYYYYYHATRMSPAELKAWMQAKVRANTPTYPPAPVRPAEPSGQPDWLVLTLGVLSAALALVAGLAVLAARRASRRLRTGHAA